jgi:hypothetical protein
VEDTRGVCLKGFSVPPKGLPANVKLFEQEEKKTCFCQGFGSSSSLFGALRMDLTPSTLDFAGRGMWNFWQSLKGIRKQIAGCLT